MHALGAERLDPVEAPVLEVKRRGDVERVDPSVGEKPQRAERGQRPVEHAERRQRRTVAGLAPRASEALDHQSLSVSARMGSSRSSTVMS